MGLSYTSGADRDRRRGAFGSGQLRGDLLLIATACVSMLAIVLCYAGRLRAFDTTEAERGGRPIVNLSEVTGADDLEPVMALAFEQPADRRFAARELLASLVVNGERAAPANVGAIARIEVPVAAIDRAPRLVEYTARLREARRVASAAKRDAPKTIPLFTAADVGAIKPALSVRSRDDHRSTVLWCTIAFLAAFPIVSLIWRYRRVPGDRLLLATAQLLTVLGFVVMLGRPDPLRDTLLLGRYTEGVLVALVVFAGASFVNVRTASFLAFSYLPLIGALLLSVGLIAFGTGPGSSGAKVNLGPVQPIEAIRLLLALFLAGYFARRWEFIRQLRGTAIRSRPLPAWLDLPRADHVLPVLVGVAMAMALFFVQKDLGPALLLSLIFVSMYVVARAGIGMAAAGAALLAAGFYLGHKLGISSTLTARVAMWQSPWDNAVRGGDQVAQAAWAMASGAIQGTGLGLGDTRYLPAGQTDLVLAAVGEELGAVGILVIIVACGLIAWRGLSIARSASTDYGVFLALAMTLSLAVPVLVMGAGLLGLMPLTGVVTPFLSYGGSAMTANFAALGLLVAVASDAGRAETGDQPFRVPVRWIGRTLAVASLVLIAVWARVQVVQADEFLVKPQLSVQGDGGRRYQYNPRVLDAMRVIPRGTVFDRREVPLASDDPAVVQSGTAEYARMNVAMRSACATPQERCYPLGGAAFHLLGDVRTRSNWGASNTSYVERDAEDALRGFDDRAIAVRAGTAERSVTAIRRDYQELIPLVRHRWEREHPDVQALLARPRDIRLTIDARLQHDVAGIVSRAVIAAGITRAAAVVIDTSTGDVLASVSYPWPSGETAGPEAARDVWLDRARYGLYPPGSTFKLLTAAAALRQNPDLARLSFTCERLPGNRIGAKIPGWSRPIRDDVLDSHAHGTIAMHDGLVRSCNAYFAQLAVRLGQDPMAKTASLAGIALSTSGSAARARENLPHAGYGQGDVLATPLRMARVAAAIASDGTIRETPIVRDFAEPASTLFLSPEGAQLLGGYMRDAVTNGTGRLLSGHPARIAGKTGTAEVDEAASHAWFVGFAPHGAATRRVAFAVILENAGYGGASAASVAGQIVSAAAALGLAR